MPVFQDLAKRGQLEAHEIDLKTALKKIYQDEYNATSHRWTHKSQPDESGEQLQAIQNEARKNPKLQWFWIDYPCLPQDTRDPVTGEVTREKNALEKRFSIMLFPA